MYAGMLQAQYMYYACIMHALSSFDSDNKNHKYVFFSKFCFFISQTAPFQFGGVLKWY